MKVASIITLLPVLTFCSKQKLEEQIQVSQRKVKVNSFTNVLAHENADSTTFFPSPMSLQTTTTYGITKSDTFYDGQKGIRFELRDTDPMNNNGTRAEVVFPIMTNLHRWYSFAIYFPTADYQYDSKDEVISQWHQGGGLTPALCWRTKQNKLFLRIMGNIWIDFGTLQKDEWHTYVMEVQHSSTSSGLIKVWKDDSLVLNRSGQNMYAVGGSTSNPYWKLGIYKSGWNNNDTTDTKKRVLYYDHILYGNENASFEDMKVQVRK